MIKKIEKAIYFATKAHNGQTRKSNGLNYVYHPFIVGVNLLKNGLNEDVAIAGILHDTVEDTSVTIDEIEKEFGKEVRKYVENVTEIESDSWIDRKENILSRLKTYDLNSKLLFASDKINNLLDFTIDLEKRGEIAWTISSKDKKTQEWYYKEAYKSVILNEDENHPIFKRYKELINELF